MSLVLIATILASSISAALTIYVQDPFRNGPAPQYSPNPIIIFGGVGTTQGGFWSGITMKDEGNDWYSFTYPDNFSSKSTEIVKISQSTKTQWSKAETPIYTGTIASLFSGATAEQTSVWIKHDGGINVSDQEVTLDYTQVNGATKLLVLNPWPENSPSILLGSSTTQMRRSGTYVGWYSTYTMAARSTMAVGFTDFYKRDFWGANGKTGQSPSGGETLVDLAPYKDAGHTLYIWPEPKYDGPARVSDQFPGVFGEPNTLPITALVHDHSVTENAFQNSNIQGGLELNIAGEFLDANGRIQKGTSNASESADMPSWFAMDPRYDTCVTLELTKGYDGSWEFDSDKTNGFFPIDNFQPFGGGAEIKAGRNVSFTMEMRTQFTYYEGSNQIFEFEGDDDVWVYVNGKLAIDLGGLHEALPGSVSLDAVKTEFGLVDGESYNLDMFYCERFCTIGKESESANFFMKTTINLETANTLLIEEVVVGDDIEIIIKKLKSEYSSDCGVNVSNPEDIDTTVATIDTYILYGPQFGASGDTLTMGTNYGGLTISSTPGDVTNDKFSVQKNSITGLKAGEYTVVFIDNAAFSGSYKFIVEGVSPLVVDTATVAVSELPAVIDYEGRSITAGFTTDSDCIIKYEVIRGTASVTGAGEFVGSGSIEMLDDTVDIKVSAIGNSTTPYKTLSTEQTYRFIRTLPAVKIVATKSAVAPDEFTFATTKLPVILSLVDGDDNTIPLTSDMELKWSLGGASDPSTGTPFVAGDTVWIEKTDTLKATATMTNYSNPSDGIWYYKQTLPSTRIIADSSKALPDSVIFDTRQFPVVLSIEDKDGNAIPLSNLVKLWYTIGAGTETPFNIGDTVWITQTDTLHARAEFDAQDFAPPADGIWYYYQDLSRASLEAKPSASPEYLFGHELKVALETTGENIRYRMDDQDADMSSTLYTDTIRITDTDPDTVYINGFAYGTDLESSNREWKYVRDTLPTVQINTSSTKFTGTLPVELSLDVSLDNGWDNVRIFYTVDGSTPDENSAEYFVGTPVQISSSMTLKSIAYADNRVESPIAQFSFTLAAGISNAWYSDRSGDGAIDFATIVVSKDLSNLPTSITLTSPFDDTEVRTVVTADIAQPSSNRLEVSIEPPFTFTRETVFDAKEYGALEGDEFLANTVITVADSVAPVLISAEYFSGRIVDDEATPIVRDIDTLRVTFSEDIAISDMSEPFTFTSNGTPYRVTMSSGTTTLREATFLVNTIIGIANPIPGDLIHINPNGTVAAAGVYQVNPNNRWIDMTVHEPPYSLKIKALSPANPDEYVIPDELTPTIYKGANGVVIVADFMMQLWNMDGLQSEITIFDALGNIVAQSNSIGSGDNLVAELKTSPRTRLVYYWNGRNLTNRRVSSGAYIAVVTVTPPDGDVVQERITIGIKK